MALPRLIDIALGNVALYQNRFEGKSDIEKTKVDELHESLNCCINMEMDTLHKMLLSRYKNRFDVCSERAGMSIDEFRKLPIKQQIDTICANMSSENRVYGIRRVDFSNRFEDDLRQYYLAFNAGISAGNTKYGRCCAIVNTMPSMTDVLLKYDSLTHYYNDANEFNEDDCHKDMLPRDNTALLLADKFSDQLTAVPVDDIKRTVENDPDPIEIMTTTIINGSRVDAVVISSDLYRYITFDLNKKGARGDLMDSKEKEDVQNLERLQLELRRRGIILRIA